jgi:hypothetical protein
VLPALKRARFVLPACWPAQRVTHGGSRLRDAESYVAESLLACPTAIRGGPNLLQAQRVERFACRCGQRFNGRMAFVTIKNPGSPRNETPGASTQGRVAPARSTSRHTFAVFASI